MSPVPAAAAAADAAVKGGGPVQGVSSVRWSHFIWLSSDCAQVGRGSQPSCGVGFAK